MPKTTNCILTINDDTNFGNRLQNYALQEILKTYGPVTTILFGNTPKQQMKTRTKHILQDVLHMLRHPKFGFATLRRHLAFYSFTRKMVPNNKVYEPDGTVHSSVSIHKVIIGSDQVWNYSFDWLAPSLQYRLGASFPEASLLSYAASLGVDSVDQEFRPVFEQYLERIPHISVREIAAQKALQPFVAQKISVVLDPTLMLSADQWRVIEPSRRQPTKPYILTYFLGEPSTEQEAQIRDFAKIHHCTIKRLNDPRDTETYASGPREFVDLFDHATYVFTDSYHACCFSIIFNKDFKVFSRNSADLRNMNSRMTTLFELLDLNNARTQSDDEVYPTYDHQTIQNTLHSLQQQSSAWLRNAMMN